MTRSDKSKRGKEATLQLQRQMVDNVARMGRSVDVMASADIARQIEQQQEKKLNHELAMMDVSPSDKKHQLLSRRIEQIDGYITKLETMQQKLDIEPKQLSYNKEK